jgi:CHAD domain-containing protein
VPLAKRKADRLTKRLKRLRHGLGDQRDRDVMLGRLRGLLEKSTDPVEQRVWQETVKCLERETAKNTGAARRELRRFDQKSIRRKIGKLLAKNLKSCDPWAMVNQSLRQAARNWRLAVRTAVSGG